MTWVTYENRAIYIYLPPNATKIDLFEAYIAPKIEDKLMLLLSKSPGP